MKLTEWQSWDLNPGLCVSKVLVVCDHRTWLLPCSKKVTKEGTDVREWTRKTQGVWQESGRVQSIRKTVGTGKSVGKRHMTLRWPLCGSTSRQMEKCGWLQRKDQPEMEGRVLCSRPSEVASELTTAEDSLLRGPECSICSTHLRAFARAVYSA